MIVTISVTSALAQVPKEEAGPATIPPWQRTLDSDSVKEVQKLEKTIDTLGMEGRFADAVKPAHDALAIRLRIQGDDHWETLNARIKEQTCLRVAGLDRKIQSELATAIRQYPSIEDLHAKGRYSEATPLLRTTLAIFRRALGEDHPDTAQTYDNLAGNLDSQVRYSEARPLYERALAIMRKVLGENHPDTARVYNNSAANLDELARYGEAQPLHERALAIRVKALGENHGDTAHAYNNLANNLRLRGRYSEAQPLYERALASWRKLWGEYHPDTAMGYNNLAYNLNAQGKYGEAQPLYERALAIQRKILGETHTQIAMTTATWRAT